MKKIVLAFHLFKEKILLIFFTLLFCLLALGGMQMISEEFGALPYPTNQTMVVLNEIQGTKETEEIYQGFEKLARDEHIVIIKNVIDDHGNNLGYTFGEKNSSFNNPKMYTKNKILLKTTTVKGSYYINGNVSEKVVTKFENLGVNIQLYETPVWFVAVNFLNVESIYSLSFLTMLLMFFVVVYALLVSRMKEMIIERSFGIFHKKNFFRTLRATGTVLGGFVFFGLLVSSIFGYFGTVKFINYNVTLLMMCVSMILLLIMAHIVFGLQVVFSKISDVQKNKLSGKSIQIVWLVVIAISTIMVTVETSTICKNYPKYLAQKHLTNEWSLAKDYARIWWRMPESGSGVLEDEEAVKKRDNDMNDFAKSFSSDEVILSKITNSTASDFGNVYSWDEEKQEENIVNVDSQLAKNIFTINPKVLKLNEKIHPENQYTWNKNNVVTIFIPEKYKEREKEIKFIAFEGLSQIVSEDEIDVQIIPNNQKFFLFIMESESSLSLPDSDKKDPILVNFDWNNLKKSERSSFLIGNFTFDALYYSKGLQEKASKYNVLNEVHNFLNVKMSLDEMNEYLNRQFLSGIVLLIVMFLFQLFVIYDFLKMQLQFYSKQIIIRTIIGKNFHLTVLRFQAILPILLVIVELASVAMTNSLPLAIGFIGLYLLSTLLIYLLAFRSLRKNKHSILKGATDVL